MIRAACRRGTRMAAQRPLLVPESLHGIDAQRTAGRPDGCREAYAGDRKHSRPNHYRIAGTGLIDDAG